MTKIPQYREFFRQIPHRLRWWSMGSGRIRNWLDARLHLTDARWLFVLGVNNSGTTLLNRIIESHPKVSGMMPEGQNITRAYPHPYRLGVPRVFSEREDVLRWTEEDDSSPALRALYDWSYYLSPGPYFLEKSPTNTLRSRWLQKNFSPAWFVAIVRHPVAVCEGIRRRSSNSLERAARHWLRANEILMEDKRRLERFLLIRYEDFCADSDHWLKRMQVFLELEEPFDSGLAGAEFAIHNVDERSSSIADLNAKSFARLSADDIQLICRIAKPMMDTFGYTAEVPWLSNVPCDAVPELNKPHPDVSSAAKPSTSTTV